jgi:hypothetical protein
MSGLESHPFPIEGSSMVVSVLFPVLTLKDDPITEYGHQLSMGNSDVASQLFPFRNLLWFEDFPKFEDFFGNIYEKWGWGECGRRCSRNIDSRIGL